MTDAPCPADDPPALLSSSRPSWRSRQRHTAEPAYDTSRIVSIGGAITEILYALGLEQRIVAVDSTSFYPPQALREKPNVGYMRQLSPEGVLGLNPSLILATEGAGPKETVAVLEVCRRRLRVGAGSLHRRRHRREDPRHRRRSRRRRSAANVWPRPSPPTSTRWRGCAPRIEQAGCERCSCCRSSATGRRSPAATPPPTASCALAGADQRDHRVRGLQGGQRRGHHRGAAGGRARDAARWPIRSTPARCSRIRPSR